MVAPFMVASDLLTTIGLKFFDVQENPTNYIIDEEDGQLMIRTTYSGKEAETQVAMNLMDGTDGIAAMEPFEGIYTV